MVPSDKEAMFLDLPIKDCVLICTTKSNVLSGGSVQQASRHVEILSNLLNTRKDILFVGI